MLNGKYIIGIDGKSGVGKSSLSKYLKEKYKNVKVVHLDAFRCYSEKDFVNIAKGEDGIKNFLDKYYNQEKIKKEIESSDEDIIILEGCFLKKLGFGIDLYKKIEEYKNHNNDMLLKIKSKNKKLTNDETNAYLEVWDSIWKFYEESI
ncbi:hypothetical protein GW764_03115 [Candidatus Parcubacteria bacterium]|nr:hypothetical protein [Candidatus Parcubacteria bacterium]